MARLPRTALGTVVLIPLLLAGCGEQYPMSLWVENLTDTPESVNVIIRDEGGRELFNQTYDLEPQSTTGRFRPDIPQGHHRLVVTWRSETFEVDRDFVDGRGGVTVSLREDVLEVSGGGGLDRFEAPPAGGP